MPIAAFDLGGTKLSSALFSEAGEILSKNTALLDGRKGTDVGDLILWQLEKFINFQGGSPTKVGISVPGISNQKTGRVWAPNIPGWDDFPLLQVINEKFLDVVVRMDSDRACSILGECWQGNAKDCSDAIFLAVGTGIGAGILVNGNILRGSSDIAGAIGWMALDKPFQKKYEAVGCFEYYASGDGVARYAKELMVQEDDYEGPLKKLGIETISASDIFSALDGNDPVAKKTVEGCIEFWGMATANLVSLFNPQKIIFGGGIFGPAVKFIPAIKMEAAQWAQPISMKQVTFEPSALGSDAALYGAAYLTLKK
jgi:glucokinase